MAIEIKGRMGTFMVLRMLTSDTSEVLRQLDGRLTNAPDLFSGVPLVLAPADGLNVTVETLRDVAEGLKERGLLPVGSMNVSEALASAAGLGLIRNLAAATREKPAPAAAPAGPAQVVTQPVRSGQQIYARGGDLVVTAPVSAGAEIMADGHIHVYNTLRGRALAGVQGATDARIFCMDQRAELLAIAGHYQLSDQIDPALGGISTMAWLEGDSLQIQPAFNPGG
ncbi:septum site-determining protein MinC [Spiribacter sp. C176]|uniref:Probable septum site-determining protein MinC n=1 Tax=Spiribacter salilacus TaxID=2664894 RepID=A0A6N7QWS8_9GAMM|nr:septum site-determining protein MinC [Spiribacter salilacus]MRH78777.1 septum site-determining protein MinC [Spiribacter salilacus]